MLEWDECVHKLLRVKERIAKEGNKLWRLYIRMVNCRGICGGNTIMIWVLCNKQTEWRRVHVALVTPQTKEQLTHL